MFQLVAPWHILIDYPSVPLCATPKLLGHRFLKTTKNSLAHFDTIREVVVVKHYFTLKQDLKLYSGSELHGF